MDGTLQRLRAVCAATARLLLVLMCSERQAHNVTELIGAFQGHRFCYISKARVHIPISGQ